MTSGAADRPLTLESAATAFIAWLRRLLRRIPIYAFLILFLLIVALPFISISLAAFKTSAELTRGAFTLPAEWRWSNFSDAWTQAHFDWYFRNSAIVAVPVVAVGTLLSIFSGYAFGLMRFPLSRLLFALFLLGIMVPQEAYIIPLYYLLRGIGLVDTYWAMILPQIGMSVCFGSFWMRGFFSSFPADTLDAARVDGCSIWTALWRVLLPNAGAAISTLVVLLFIWTWNDFLIALVVVSSDTLRTLPLGLAFFQGRYASNVPLMAAGAIIVLLPTLIIYVLFQRQFIQGVTSGTLHG